MSRPNQKTRLPNKSITRPSVSGNITKASGELTNQQSVKCTKDDIKYWKNREQELLAKISDLENLVANNKETIMGKEKPEMDSSTTTTTTTTGVGGKGKENDEKDKGKEKENYKNKIQTIEKEILNKQKELTTETNYKNFKSSEEVANYLKIQNEDLRNALAKMTTILRDKTTMCISQEKKIAALVNQVESLKEVVAITKDLLNIRNMEVQHLSNDITAMETKIDCERQRHNQMLVKMDEAVKLNSDLKKEYENQLKLFQHLRESYEKKMVFLSRDQLNGKNDNNTQIEKGIVNSNSDSQVQSLTL
ncbi:conserved hypothetical protein [Pediculus humanus corporis]|uniref:Uncharacterized protein n=1 Tax=Pediculus humanus subsp. corporis TaxID=121224 RepID=E0VD24_PEDHC|nr:uncharacterized protein Phum_PHUM104080 [Pediculus humanus corporis]EEB11280.1 conserved hypothetical protein [Pediculus humanus corporis]